MALAISASHQALFDVFKEAIEDERKSQDLYQRAAGLCEDKVMRKLFIELRAEEEVHEARLQRMYGEFRPLVAGGPTDG
jgi:rubrerythrin